MNQLIFLIMHCSEFQLKCEKLLNGPLGCPKFSPQFWQSKFYFPHLNLSLSLCNSILVERLYDIFVKYSVEICRPNPWPTLVIKVSFQVTKVLSAKQYLVLYFTQFLVLLITDLCFSSTRMKPCPWPYLSIGLCQSNLPQYF